MRLPLHGGMAEGLLLLRQEIRDSDHSDHTQSERPDLKKNTETQTKNALLTSKINNVSVT